MRRVTYVNILDCSYPEHISDSQLGVLLDVSHVRLNHVQPVMVYQLAD